MRSSASTRPAAMPVTTTSAARPTVRKKPSTMAGRYFAITAVLRNVSAKRSQPDIQCRWIWPMKARVRSSRGAAKICCRRSLLDHQPGVHEQHAIRGGAGKAHLVRYHHHRHAALAQFAHHREHAADQFGIQRAGGFVEQHDARLQRDGSGDRHALLLAAGQLAGIMPGAIRQPDARQRRLADGIRLRAPLAGHLAQGERHIAAAPSCADRG